MSLTRREFGKLALSSLPFARWMEWSEANLGGVRIGLIAPYAFRRTARTAEEILSKLVALGIREVELQNPPVEAFAGAPPPGPRGRRRQPLTPEQEAARNKAAEELRSWRLSVSMEKFRALRQLYEDSGVGIYAFKLALSEEMSDGEFDYCFKVAQALGASHVTMELPESADLTGRIGEFAAKHKIHVGYHNHTQVDEKSWDTALSQSPYNGINLDAGHFTAAISGSPIPFIQRHHDRIQSMHFKDRKYGTAGGDNVPWGQGDTPLREILKLMKREQYRFPATIELEYPIPQGSNVMAELAKCFRYCQEALS